MVLLHTLLYDPAFDRAKFFQVTLSEQRMHTVICTLCQWTCKTWNFKECHLRSSRHPRPQVKNF